MRHGRRAAHRRPGCNIARDREHYWVFVILRACYGGGTYADRIKQTQIHLKEWYSQTRTTQKIQGPLTLERLRATGAWPKLKAKAAATRHMAKFALHLVQQFGQLESLDDFVKAHDQLALGVAQTLVEFYDILMSQSQFMAAGVRDSLPEKGNLLAQMYAKLSKLCFDADQRLWKLSPKLHRWLHLTEDQAVEFGNPRFWWTYGDEDLIGQLIEMADDLHPATLPGVLLTKWLLLVHDEVMVDPSWSPHDHP